MRHDQIEMSMRAKVLGDPDTEYQSDIGKIAKVMLGYEDHGLPTAWLHIDGAGWGQGAGGRCLGKEYTHRFIFGVLDCFGAKTWESLPGRSVIILRKDPFTEIAGIADPDTSKVFMFSSIESE